MSFVRATIESFCDVGSGTTPSRAKADRYYGGNIPWVKSGELRETIITKTEEMITPEALSETSLKLVPRGAVLVAMYGATVGRAGMLGIDATTNQAVCHVVPNASQADSRFVFHALCARLPEFVSKSVGGAQPNISQQIIRKTVIPLPPLDEQRRIAAILDAAAALCAKRRATIAKLDTLVQSIFIEMFGNPAKNPMEWPVVPIGDLLSSASYGTSEKADTEGTLPILRMNNITYDGKIDLKDLKYINLDATESDRYLVRSGDILFNRTNSPDLVGKTAVFRSNRKMAFAGYLVRLRTNQSAVPDYISGFLNSMYGKATLRGMCKTIIGMANINATEVQSIRIPKPPKSLQSTYASRIEAIIAVDAELTLHSTKLAFLFASLQHRAFHGEL